MNQEQIDGVSAIARFVASPESLQHRAMWRKGYHTLYQIWTLLQDGEWHTTSEIAQKVGRSQSHVKTLLSKAKKTWGLASSFSKGYLLPQKNKSIIV